ncbi:non-ribosomal peptide synthetase [Pseudoalteromonas luteoviolacea]|uniref:non-ribosomal peptide synthetase n=1 Tax=Pseudoalteromonas luteoviolacea TaxID=43657 RepID=UPI001B37416F|nr:non-ribosomal peptide synthetase [Pseudoalteromonas luteoviolacea]MBQ4835995.1 amino acid adenylation domain-containing protein [Pseudoalteromonas luteoviolacea]
MTLNSLVSAEFNIKEKANSLVDIVKHYAEVQPDKHAYRFLKNGEDVAQSLTYRELDLYARAIASNLQAGATIERAMLVYSPGLEFVKAFFGCLYAGVASVPVYLPSARVESWQRLRGIMNDAEVQAILLEPSCVESVNKWLFADDEQNKPQLITTNSLDDSAENNWVEPVFGADKLAFLQYTSGSTGDPKGVMVSHGNLLHNQSLIEAKFCHTNESVVVGWLPQYHDMGLIGNILHPVYMGATSVLMSPAAFLQNPLRWLKAISQYQANTSGGPNFAFDLCVQRVSEADKKTLDLSSWDVAFNGAEPISPQTLENFYQAFKGCGFKRQAFYPCYGLAESTLMVSGVEKAAEPAVVHLDRRALEDNYIEVKSAPDDGTCSLVSCGGVEPDVSLQIVNPDSGMVLEEGSVGEIWVGGDSVGLGYWKREALSQSAFYAQLEGYQARFLRTGDLGFVHNGQVFVSGRLKDLIILRGKNYYPQDLEATAQSVSAALKPARGIAFIDETPHQGAQPSVVLIQEVERTSLRKVNFTQLEKSIKQAIYSTFDLHIEVLLVKPGQVPITSSGKVRRSLCKANYQQDQYQRLNEAQNTASMESPEQPQWQPNSVVEHFMFDWLKLHFKQSAQRNKPLLDYGIDSMKAAQLQYDIETELSVIYPMEKLLNTSSLGQLIEELTTLKTTVDAQHTHCTPSGSSATKVNGELSTHQAMFWQIDNQSGNTAALNLSLPILIRGTSEQAFCIDIFTQALNALIAQQPTLRTVYQEQSGEAKQVVKSMSDFKEVLTYQDAATWSTEELNTQIQALATEPFDLKDGPVFRATVFARNNGAVLFHFVAHHIAMDAWSIQKCIQQIAKNYASLLAGRQPERIISKVSYLDYCHRQASDSRQQAHAESARFWRREFEGFSEVTELPADSKSPKVFNFEGGNLDVRLPGRLRGDIYTLAKRKGVTPYTLLLSAFNILLHKFMGNEDIVIGTPISQRPMVDCAEVAGCFVDVKPVRTKIHGGMLFNDLLKSVKNTFLSVLENKCYPSQRIFELPQLRDALRAANIFPNVRFALQKAPDLESVGEFFLATDGANINLHGLELSSYEAPSQIAQAELSLTVVECTDKAWLRFNYSTQLFERGTVEYLAKCFIRIVESLTHQSEQSIDQIVLPRRDNAEQLLAVARGQEASLTVKGVHQLFERQVAVQPDAIAVVCEQQQVTYSELNHMANTIAHTLLSHKLAPESTVAIYMHRSVEMVAAFLGGLKARACCVLIEPTTPRERREHILADSNAKFVLTDKVTKSVNRVDQLTEIIVDDNLFESVEKYQNPDLPVSDTDAAYVIYTSGSTGKPKGVVGIHKGMINRTQWMIETFSASHLDVVLHCTPFNFVRAERELFFALGAGAQLVVLQQNALNEPAAFMQAMQTHKVTFTATSPAHIKTLLDYDKQAFSRLVPPRHWFIGADVLDHTLVSKLQSIHGTMTLSYFYGSTETTSDVSCFTVPKNYSGGAFTTPIGRPLTNTQLYILDKAFNPVPSGGKGELYVAGDQISRGYLNASELTDQKYIDNPFSAAKERLYRTGDLARQLSNGDIIILGREDAQVNLNGFRIDLSEVEHGIYRLESVKDVAVRLHQENADKQYIVAYVVLSSDMQTQAQEEVTLRRHVQSIFNEYMQPSVYVFVEQLPRTELGKLDHRRLPEPSMVIEQARVANYEAPENELEVLLVGIWQEILQLEQVGVEDNFYQLGGNSLLSVKIVAEIEEQIGVSVTLKAFFDALTIRALAEKILTIAMQEMPQESEF